MENKANVIQVRKLQADLASSDNTQAVKKLLEEKDNALQVLKKRLKMPGSEHVQSAELLALQEEKDKVHQEMMEYKEKLESSKRKRIGGKPRGRSCYPKSPC